MTDLEKSRSLLATRMQATVRLRKKGCFPITLYHDKYCENGGPCECRVVNQLFTVQERDGSQGLKYVDIRYPKTVHLNGQTVELHEAILKVPQVIEAQRRGILEVKVIEPTNR